MKSILLLEDDENLNKGIRLKLEKELGMLQAVGMTDRQLLKMLQSEGLFYTMGTLFVAIPSNLGSKQVHKEGICHRENSI